MQDKIQSCSQSNICCKDHGTFILNGSIPFPPTCLSKPAYLMASEGLTGRPYRIILTSWQQPPAYSQEPKPTSLYSTSIQVTALRYKYFPYLSKFAIMILSTRYMYSQGPSIGSAILLMKQVSSRTCTATSATAKRFATAVDVIGYFPSNISVKRVTRQRSLVSRDSRCMVCFCVGEIKIKVTRYSWRITSSCS
jgi:hypothetical protein